MYLQRWVAGVEASIRVEKAWVAFIIILYQITLMLQYSCNLIPNFSTQTDDLINMSMSVCLFQSLAC